ncbi:Uncharacterised protein [[Clostridium] sordellii]|nr:Uncharacterised protein [[Clostridium] sordellii] [Paeniclostridium sordellii]
MLGINRLVILKFCVKAEGMSLTEIKEILQILLMNRNTVMIQKYRQLLKSILVIRYLHLKNISIL